MKHFQKYCRHKLCCLHFCTLSVNPAVLTLYLSKHSSKSAISVVDPYVFKFGQYHYIVRECFINSSSNNGNLGQIEEEADLNLHFVL